MYKFFILFSLLFTSLYAVNPKAYESLGDKIYDNVENVKKLISIGDYYLYVDDINKYITAVNAAKQEGFLLDANSSSQQRKNYLKKLRELASENDYYVRMAETSLSNAISNADSLLFTKILNTGLIDLKAHKKEILDYYFTHKNDIKASGALKEFIDKSTAFKSNAEAEARRNRSKKLREELKIKRLRERDRKRQLELEKKLDQAVEKKKMEIRQEQREELIKSI